MSRPDPRYYKVLFQDGDWYITRPYPEDAHSIDGRNGVMIFHDCTPDYQKRDSMRGRCFQCGELSPEHINTLALFAFYS